MTRREILKWMGAVGAGAAVERIGAAGEQARAAAFDPAFGTVADAVAALGAKRISAVELRTETLRRVDRFNPALNAIIWECRDEAMARARLADAALARGGPVGPLHGVPITIKDSFHYPGSAATWGMTQLKGVLGTRPAVPVARLEAAGAIVIGKTNVPVQLADFQSFNPIYGTTNNPWDVSRTPGGSTGGGAAAVAAGLGALTLGSDIGGSIRVPAHFCGIYGHKPTIDLVEQSGHAPGPWDGTPGMPMDLAVSGPLARSARDLLGSLAVLGGPRAEAAPAWTWRLPPPRKTRLRELRVGYVLDDPRARVSADQAAALESVVAALGRAGARVTAGWPEGLDLDVQHRTYQFLMNSVFTAGLPPEARAEMRQAFERDRSNLWAASAVEPHGRWVQETARRLRIRAVWQQYFASYDVFLLPTAVCAAFPHDHREPMETRMVDGPAGPQPYLNTLFWSASATLPGLPATVAPAGKTAGGLPVGIQIVGPLWEDATPIECAALLADLVGGFTPPPGY